MTEVDNIAENTGENAIEIIDKLTLLTKQEMTVLYWKCRGLQINNIASQLKITPGTVSRHTGKVYEKFEFLVGVDVSNRDKEIEFKEYVCGVVKAVIKDPEDLERWYQISNDLKDQLEKHKTEDEPVIFIPEEEPTQEPVETPVEESEEEPERPWYVDEITGRNLVDVAIGSGEFLDEIFSKLGLVEGSVERVEKSVDEIKEALGVGKEEKSFLDSTIPEALDNQKWAFIIVFAVLVFIVMLNAAILGLVLISR